MKKLGLIGGTGPESTVIYYQKITGGVQKRLNKNQFPPLTIESLDVFEVLDRCGRQDYNGLVDYLLAGIAHLQAAGADFAALTGITPHIVFDRLQEKASIPIVSMVETACQYAALHQFQKIALLGTTPTMNGTFFQKPFGEKNIAVVTPSETEKAYIGTIIETELEYGIINPQTIEKMTAIARRLIAEEGVDAVVLGCTELPLLFNKIELPAAKMDVMDIHISALTDKILEG